MGLWDTMSGWFGGAGEYDPYTDIYISPEQEPPLTPPPTYFEPGAYYDPSVKEPPLTPPPTYFEPGAYYDPSVKEPWYGSLWGAFKEAGQQVIKSPLLPALINKDKTNLMDKFPRLGITPDYDRQDAQLYTPYPRGDTGSRPISIGAMPGGGLSPMILLMIGAAAFLMLRKR